MLLKILCYFWLGSLHEKELLENLSFTLTYTVTYYVNNLPKIEYITIVKTPREWTIITEGDHREILSIHNKKATISSSQLGNISFEMDKEPSLSEILGIPSLLDMKRVRVLSWAERDIIGKIPRKVEFYTEEGKVWKTLELMSFEMREEVRKLIKFGKNQSPPK